MHIFVCKIKNGIHHQPVWFILIVDLDVFFNKIDFEAT